MNTPKYNDMSKKTYNETPSNYPVCEFSNCPQAETCLHQTAYNELIKDTEHLFLINPNRCSQSGDCKYYRNNAPVTYARGFTHFQSRMYPPKYRKFMAKCMAHWSRNTYYERRRGDYPLPPSEQEFILKTLKDCGVTEELKFDSYEQLFNWYD